ncbi:unnamed protein product [Prunus armeniaca]
MTAVDLINLSPSALLNGDVPNKFWSEKNVSYNHLKVFGCKAFVHVPKDMRSKLEAKSKECIFVRYGNEEFGYRLWDPVARKIIRSRDVVLFEDQNIEDIRRCGKPNNPREYPANLDPIPPPLEHNDGQDKSNDTDDLIINEPIDDDVSDGHTTNGIVDNVAYEGQEAQAH